MTDADMTNKERDDQLLSAYLDGELPEEQADALTQRLADEPALARRLADLRSADGATRALYDRLDEVPMPPEVLALLDSAKTASDDNVVEFRPRGLRRFWQAPVAIAASAALAAGFLADRLLTLDSDVASGIDALVASEIAPGSDVHQLLESAASGQAVPLADGSEGRIILTFATADGNWCRQLRAASAEQVVDGVACRRDGRWRTEALGFAEPLSGGYAQASGGAPAAIAATVLGLSGDSQPIDSVEEEKLLERNWQ